MEGAAGCQSASSVRAVTASTNLFVLTKKINNKTFKWNFLTTIWTNNHQALLDSACQIELKFP